MRFMRVREVGMARGLRSREGAGLLVLVSPPAALIPPVATVGSCVTSQGWLSTSIDVGLALARYSVPILMAGAVRVLVLVLAPLVSL